MIKEIRSMEELFNITLVSVDMELFQANKVVLASVSTKFRDMFQMNEEDKSIKVYILM